MILCNSFPPSIGGVGRYAYYIVKHLKYKYNFIIISMADKNYIHVKTYFTTNSDKLISQRVVYLVPKTFTALPYFSTLSILVKSLLLKTHTDIIHTHSLGQIHSDMSLLLKRKTPLVYTIHAWRNAENLIIQKLYNKYESIAPFFLKKADIITVLGNKSKEYVCSLLEETDLYKEKVVIAPNGVDFYTIRKLMELAKAKELRREEKMILYVGRLVKTKGVVDLLASFKVLSKIDTEAMLVIKGDGPLKLFIKNFINRYGLKERVKFIEGVLPWEKVIFDYYSKASVFVLPSYAEGLPTVILEAMSAEVPVITTPVGDIPDIIHHGETGIFVNPGDIKALTNSILTLLQDKGLRRKIISNALNVAMKHDWRFIVSIFDKIYGRATA